MAILKGTEVKQVVVEPIVGKVVEYCVDQENGSLQYRVEWVCDEGHIHSKWFNDGEIAPV
jgi:uncharacterized membrane protein YkoI